MEKNEFNYGRHLVCMCMNLGGTVVERWRDAALALF